MNLETQNSPRTCLVTGARGWLGRCVCARFREEGWRVRELTRSPDPAAVERGEAIPFQLGDALAPEALAGASALVHCAYDFEARTWPEIHARNVRGAAELFDAARAAGIARLVCISTMSAYAGCRSLYGRAKLEIENTAFAAGALVLRPGLIWGAEAGGMFGALVKQVSGGKALPLIGGSQILYLVHQEDLAELIHRFARGDFETLPDPVTAAHQRPWTFRAILEEIARALSRHPIFVPLPWRLVWAALKTAELGGLRLGFRSDSLVSLMNQNPCPDFSQGPKIGFVPRAFEFTLGA